MSVISKALGLDSPKEKATLNTLNAVGHVAETVVESAFPAVAPIVTALQGTPAPAPVHVEQKPLSGVGATIEKVARMLDPRIGDQIEAAINALLHRFHLDVAEAEIDRILTEEFAAIGVPV